MGDLAQQLADLDVGEVAVFRGNALFDRPRALGVELEEFIVVVRLHEKGGEVSQPLNHAAGDEARVGNEAEAIRGISDHEANGIDRIMLDREGLHRQMSDGKFLPGLEGFPNRALDALLADDMSGVPRGKHGHGLFFEKIFQPANMIAVLVGEEDGGNRFGSDAERFEA